MAPLTDTYLPNQDRHHFVGFPGGNGFASIVRFGIVESVQQLDGVLYGSGTAKQHMA